jgi:hypothetical protein
LIDSTIISIIQSFNLSQITKVLIDVCFPIVRPDKLEVFSFMLRAQTPTALASLTTKMQGNSSTKLLGWLAVALLWLF